MFERSADPPDSDMSSIRPGALGPRPRLRLGQELLQLAEDEQRRSVLTVKGLDPVEALEHAPCFIHAPTVAVEL